MKKSVPMYYEDHGTYTLLYVKAVPGSSINKVAEVTNDYLRIKVKAPAVEGAANAELIKFVAKLLRVSKGSVQIDKGSTSKIKTLRIDGEGLALDKAYVNGAVREDKELLYVLPRSLCY